MEPENHWVVEGNRLPVWSMRPVEPLGLGSSRTEPAEEWIPAPAGPVVRPGRSGAEGRVPLVGTQTALDGTKQSGGIWWPFT